MFFSLTCVYNIFFNNSTLTKSTLPPPPSVPNRITEALKKREVQAQGHGLIASQTSSANLPPPPPLAVSQQQMPQHAAGQATAAPPHQHIYQQMLQQVSRSGVLFVLGLTQKLVNFRFNRQLHWVGQWHQVQN